MADIFVPLMMIIAGLEAGRHDDVWAFPDADLRGHSADQHPGDTFIMTALASDTRDRIGFLFAALMVTRRKVCQLFSFSNYLFLIGCFHETSDRVAHFSCIHT